MKRTLPALLLCAALTTACGPAAPDRVAEPTTTDDTRTVGEVAGREPIPSPSAQQAAELELAVAAIYPDVPEGKAIDWARYVCADVVRDGLAGEALLDRIRFWFKSGSDRPEPTPEQSQAILNAIEAGGWCKQG